MSIQAGLKERAYSIAEMAETPEQIKAAQRTLSQSVQNGSLPSYVGIPLINELNQKMAKAKAAMSAPMPGMVPQQPQSPPIAQQVMQQAQADQGVPALSSNLPTEMAGGGIVAFAGGGETDRGMIEALLGRDEEETDEEFDELVGAMSGSRLPDISSILKMVEDSNLPSDEGIEALAPVESKTFLTRSPEGAAVENVTRREGDGTVQIERDKKAVRGDDGLLQYVLAKESGGRRYDRSGNLLTSPKGAQGEMQVMPGTQRDPGFGVEPARDSSPDEIARVGRDYLKALRNRYGDDKLAAIAYNMGPGATDKWLAAGADPSRLPAETRNYVAGMAEGGIASVKRFQNAGIVLLDPNDPDSWRNRSLPPEPDAPEPRQKYRDITKMTPEEIRDQARRNAAARRLSAAMPPAASTVAPAAPAAAAETPASGAKSMGRFGRIAGPLGIATLGYDVGKNVLESKQAEELKKYGPEPDLTPEEIERASRPAFMKDVSVSPKEQKDRGIKPLAPLTYTPAGVQTYGPRAGYTPPTSNAEYQKLNAGPGSSSWGMDLGTDAVPSSFAGPGEAGWGMDLGTNEVPAPVTDVGKKESEEVKEEPKSKLEQLLEARMGRLDKQRDIDNYMALLSAGLGMMGGTSPYAGANIGQGAQAGIASYLRSGATRAAEENAILSGQLGLERYKGLADIRKQGLETQKYLKGLELDLKKQVEAGKITKAQEGQRLRAAEIARRMEQDYLGRAEATARALVKNNTLLSMDEAKSNAFVQDAIKDARTRLNLQTGYRNLMRQAYDGYDPGEIDVGSDMEAIIARNLPKAKK